MKVRVFVEKEVDAEVSLAPACDAQRPTPR